MNKPLNEHPTYRRKPSLGESRVKFVTRAGYEGSLALDESTGQLLTKHEQMPEWAEGLAVGQLAEQQKFYFDRLGKDSPEALAHVQSETIEFGDLSWLAVDDKGKEYEIPADTETRLENVTNALQGMGVLDRNSGKIIGSNFRFERITDQHSPEMTAAEAETSAAELAGAAKTGQTAQEQKKGSGTR